MNDPTKTKQQLVRELAALQSELAGLERMKARLQRAREAWRLSEQRYRTLADAAHDSIFIIDRKDIVQFVNDYGAALFGSSANEMVGKPRGQWFTPEDSAKQKVHLEKVFETGEPVYSEDRIPAGGNREVWLETRLVAIRNKAGEVTSVMGIARDITERRRAEETLQHRGRQLEILLHASQQINTVLDLPMVLRTLVDSGMELSRATQGTAGLFVDGQMVFTEYNSNGTLAPIHYVFDPGYGVPGHVMQTRSPYLSNNAEQDPYVVPQIREALGFYNLVDVPILNRHGELLGCFELHNTIDHRPFTDENVALLKGLAASAAIAIENAKMIEKRRQVEEKLRESEERYRIVAETATDAIVTLDDQSKILFANSAAETIFGHPVEDMIGREVTMLMPEYLRTIHEQAVKDLASSNRRHLNSWKSMELTGLHQSGVPIPLELSLGEFKKDEKYIFTGIIRDVTERKHAEAALRFTQFAMDHAADAAFWLDPEGRFFYVNEAACRMLGYSREEVLRLSTLDISPNYSMEMWKAHWKEIKTKRSFSFEAQHQAKDGRRFPVEISVNYLEFDGREYNCAFVRDLTEHKRVETALRQMQEQLLQAQKMEAIGRLAGGVAHDFNNLLTAIIGYADLLLLKLSSGDPLCANVQEIKAAAERAASLTRQLLAFSRRQLLQPKVLGLNSLVANLEKILQRLIGEDVELVTLLAPDLGHVKADPGQIEQVIMNLVVNSRDAMPQGGKLTIQTGNADWREVTAHTKERVEPGDFVRLTVTDSGCGIDADILPRVFEPFFTTKEKDKGTGLGLSTVYGIVKQSGGHIAVDSRPGSGAIFSIYMPRVEETEEVAPSPHQQADAPLGSETVLLVEDEEMVRHLLGESLRMNGYRVVEASGGEEAIARCKQHPEPIHILLTDVIMPRMSGQELAGVLRTIRPQMKVLFMSGYTDNSMFDQGQLAQEINFIQKPFTPGHLEQKLREVLGRS